MVDNPLHIKINSQLNANASINKIDLSFLEAPQPSGDNYVTVQQNSPEWLEIRQNKVTGSRLPALLGFYGKTKFEMTLNIVKIGTTEPEMKDIKNISRGHQFEDDVIAQFESISKWRTERCGFFHFENDIRYVSSPDSLLGIFLEVKTRAEGSLSPLQSLNTVPQYFVQWQLQMLCTDAEFCILQPYHPETKTSNFFVAKHNNTLTKIIKQLIDCILDKNHVLDWAHTEVSELHGFAKEILGKVRTFELLRPVRTYIKKWAKLIPQVKFVDEFDFVVEKKWFEILLC